MNAYRKVVPLLFLAAVGLYVGVSMLYEPQVVPRAPKQLTREAAVPGEATLFFGGDTGEIDAAEHTLEFYGYQYPFSLTVDLMRDADVAIVNLEAPITAGGTRFPLYKDYIYRAPPESARALAWAGIDIVTLANNHAVDYGTDGLGDTISLVEKNGLVAIGGGENLAEARRGAIITVGNIRFGLLAYCENQILWRTYVRLFAGAHSGGAAPLTERSLKEDIARLRPQVDVLIVSLHIGYNYQPPLPSTITWSKRAIDLGADLVVDHHPHVAHPAMLHRGKPILLSLGNYVFGTPGHPELDYGWLAEVHASARPDGNKIDRIEMIPLAVQNDRVHFRPLPLAGDELTRALEKFRNDSLGYDASLEITRGRAVFNIKR